MQKITDRQAVTPSTAARIARKIRQMLSPKLAAKIAAKGGNKK